MAAKAPNPDQQPNASQPAAASSKNARTLDLRVPKRGDRKVFIAKFNNHAVEFKDWKQIAPEMAREVSVLEEQPRSATEDTPKGAAGSEMGKERRDAAKQRRYVRHKKAEDAPWVLTDNSTATKRKYRGIKEGGVQDNSAYYVFTTVGGRIEAYPVSEWFHFAPVQRYKTLTSEEAEEAFDKREKTLNHFNIMTKNRLRKEGDQGDIDEEGQPKPAGERKSRLKIRDDEDDRPQEMSDSDEEGTARDTGAVDGKEKKKKTKGGKKPAKRAPEEDGEPGEDSDDGDFETRELDYDEAAESSSEEEESVVEEETIKGIDEEIEEMLDEDDEDLEDKEADKNDEEAPPDDDEESGSDNEEEDFDAMADSIIPQVKRVDLNAGQPSTSSAVEKDVKVAGASKNGKRKQEAESVDAGAKRPKTAPAPAAPTVSDGKLEDEVRRYLQRKPLTSIELVRKLTKGFGPERTAEVRTRLGEIIKRLNPEKQKSGDKLYMFLNK